VKRRFGDSAGAVLSLYPAKSPEEVYWQEVAIRTDSRFGTGARAQLRGEFTVPSKAWSYHFSYLAPGARDPKRGVSHASELAFVFGTIPAGSTKETQDISEAMMSYWTQFAKTGDPNQAGLPQWPAFQKGSESYLEIAAPMHAGKDLNKEKADLFSRIVRPAPRN
jgi:para-nitrobenzyl esterase